MLDGVDTFDTVVIRDFAEARINALFLLLHDTSKDFKHSFTDDVKNVFWYH